MDITDVVAVFVGIAMAMLGARFVIDDVRASNWQDAAFGGALTGAFLLILLSAILNSFAKG